MQLSQCIQCPAGSYCATSGLTAVSGSCTAGYYCVAGSIQSKPASGKCTAGNYCPTGASSQTTCAAGTYQDQAEQASCITCPAGYFCVAGSTSPGVICPLGHYCPAGTPTNISYPCPTSTYNPQTGAHTSTQCKACKPGHYCASTGLGAPTGQCAAGYFCTLGSATSTPPATSETKYNTCKAGFF